MTLSEYFPKGIHADGVLLGYLFEFLGAVVYKEEWRSGNFSYLNYPDADQGKGGKEVELNALEMEHHEINEEIKNYEALSKKSNRVGEKSSIKKLIENSHNQLKKINGKIESLNGNKKSIVYDGTIAQAHDIKIRVLQALKSGELQIKDRYGTSFAQVGEGRFNLYHSTFEPWDLKAEQFLEPVIVFAEKKKVDEWVLQFKEPENDWEWLEKKFKSMDENDRMPKALRLTEFQALRPSITEYKFAQAWKNFAPPSWKTPGRNKPLEK